MSNDLRIDSTDVKPVGSAESGHEAEKSSVSGVAELQADIERTRQDLAWTVDQLTAKLDVTTRLRNRAAEVGADASRRARMLRERASQAGGNADVGTVGIGAGVLAATAAVLVVALWRRNNTSHGWRGWRR